MLLLKLLAWAALWIGAMSSWVWRPKLFWIAGGVCLVAHVGLTFAQVHDWSHAAAMEATAIQVQSVTGIRSGVGLWFNYLFLALWICVALRWETLDRRVRTVWWLGFLFMGFNAGVVFVPPRGRWVGLVWAVFAAASAVRDLRRRSVNRSANAAIGVNATTPGATTNPPGSPLRSVGLSTRED